MEGEGVGVEPGSIYLFAFGKQEGFEKLQGGRGKVGSIIPTPKPHRPLSLSISSGPTGRHPVGNLLVPNPDLEIV